ncbi:O-antigen ligase family protein [Halanaerobium saccharolyticum]|uniref:O-antigen ligase family protein n=1 Tax=Halanaerobium saccharolyticum TaxID=43595 RepID=UPI003FCEB19B
MVEKIKNLSNKSLEYLFLTTLLLFPISIALRNILLGLLLISYLFNKIINKDFSLPKTFLNKYILLFFIFSLLSFINTNNIKASLDTLLSPIFRYIAFFIIAYELIDIKRIGKYIKLLIYGALILLSVGLFIDYFTNDSFFYRANGYGATASLLIIFFLSLIIYFRKPKYYIIYFLGFFLSINALILSYSRGATLGLIFAIIYILGISIWKSLSKKYTKKILLSTMITFLILVLIITPYILPDKLINRFKNTNFNYNTNPRLLMWRTTLEMIKKHPIVGTGLGTFNYHFLYNVDNVFEGAKLSVANRKHEKPHNLYLFIASEQGLPSLIIYLLAFYLVLRMSTKKYLYNSSSVFLFISWSLIGFLIQIFIHSFVDTSVLYGHVGLYIMIFLVLFLKSIGIEKIEEN